MTYGCTPNGFVKKPMSVIQEEIKAIILGIDSEAVFDERSLYGQFMLNMSERESDLWNVLEAVYSSRSITHAEDVSLDELIALINMKRLEAVPSRIIGVKIYGTEGIVIPAGFTIVSNINPDIKYVTELEYTIPVAGFVTADFVCTLTGPNTGLAGTVTTIETYIDGVTSVEQPNPVSPGRDRESNSAVKNRRLDNISTVNASTVAGITQALMDLNKDETKPTLTYIDCIVNDLSVTDTRGRPPHSIEVVIEQQDAPTNSRDQEIAQTIFTAHGAGATIYGDGSAPNFTVYDRRNRVHISTFTRPLDVPIYASVDLTVKSLLTAAEKDSLKASIQAWGMSLGVGKDVNVLGFNGLASQIQNEKIISINSAFVGKTNPPSLTFIDIEDGLLAKPEKSTWALGNITINDHV